MASGEGPHDDDGALHPEKPGWYPDPWSATGTGERYWDGTRWLTSERPLGRGNAGPVVDLGRHRRPASRRRTWIWVALGVAVAGSVVVLGVAQTSDDSEHAVNTPSATDAATPAPTSSVAAKTALAAATSTLEPGHDCYGKDCGKLLLGDWPAIELGDCLNTDRTDRGVAFTIVPCDATHAVEVFYVSSPPTIPDPMPTTMEDLTRAVCPSSAMEAYSPSFAAAHPDPAAYAGGWSARDKRVCAVPAPDPNASIRG
ncbi:MAG TPA: DUF2510 domain-containing protein [Acidimicrobiia bacterium]